MKKTLFTLLFLLIVVLLSAPFLAGKYVGNLLQQRVDSLALVKLYNYQRGYFISTAQIEINGRLSDITITHAPLTLTGLDLAQGKLINATDAVNFSLDWQQIFHVIGKVEGKQGSAQLQSHGKVSTFPQTSVTTLTAQLSPTQEMTFSPFTATLNADHGTVEFLIPHFHLQQEDRFSLTVEKLRKKNLNAGGSEWQAEKAYLNVPNIDLTVTWRDLIFSERAKTAADGQTLSYFLHFSGQQERLSVGGAMQFFIAPLRSIIPDQIIADLTVNGINKHDRDLLFQPQWQKNEWLEILKKNVATEEMSADFQADLLRRGQGVNINLHLQENINLSNEPLFSQSLPSLYPLLSGSWVNVDIAYSVAQNPIIKNITSPDPYFWQELGFFPDQDGWHLRARVRENGVIDYQRE